MVSIKLIAPIETIDNMNFKTFDLNLMRVLDAILQEGSTVKAGAKLGLSQPAVSSALARLRHALGDELFVRQGPGLTPTDYARSLATPVRQELDRLEALFSGPGKFDPSSAVGDFKLAGSDFFAEMLMPALARKVREQAPGMRVQLVDLVPANYIDSLDQYRADLALIPNAEFPDWIERHPLFHSSFAVIARKEHPQLPVSAIAPGQTIPLDLFCDLGHVLFSPEGNTKAMGDAALARVGRSRNVVMTVPVFSGVCRAVSESDLIALIPRQLAIKVSSQLGVEVYNPPMDIEPALIVAIWHRRTSGNPVHRWMRELVAEILRPLNYGEAPLDAGTPTS